MKKPKALNVPLGRPKIWDFKLIDKIGWQEIKFPEEVRSDKLRFAQSRASQMSKDGKKYKAVRTDGGVMIEREA